MDGGYIGLLGSSAVVITCWPAAITNTTLQISGIDLSVFFSGGGAGSVRSRLFQITPYVNDSQTFNNPGSSQPVAASKN